MFTSPRYASPPAQGCSVSPPIWLLSFAVVVEALPVDLRHVLILPLDLRQPSLRVLSACMSH
jgi:hypothetical protein